jgi:MoaA/NifB/PqqE/SkfB family radical SAM enzyme
MRSLLNDGVGRSEVVQPGTGNRTNYLNTVDLIVTEVCTEDCDFCWALAPRTDDGELQLTSALNSVPAPVWNMDLDKAERFIAATEGHIRKFTVSGGEPSLYRSLPNVTERIRRAGALAVISTAGMNSKQFDATEGHTYRYEVAFDGPKEVHERSRRGAALRGKSGAFGRGVETILRAQGVGAYVAIRTLVNTDTIETVQDIPKVLKDNGVMLGPNNRMKLYQESPVGPRTSQIIAANKSISVTQLLQAALRVRQQNPDVHLTVAPWRQSTHRGAYIKPNGDAYTVGLHTETGMPEQLPLGNVFTYDFNIQHLLGAFRARHRNRPELWLMDSETRKPFDLSRWEIKADKGELDHWLATKEPEPITYEQAIRY